MHVLRRATRKSCVGSKHTKTMSLETHIAGSEDALLDALHFGGRNSASYITERRQVTFAPSSAASWKPSGTRLMRWNLADQSGWLDGKTVRLFFTLTNLSTTVGLTPTCDSVASMFRRVRIIANGSAVIEDIEENGRLVEMFSYLLPANRRMGNLGESWGASSTTPTLTNLAPINPLGPNTSRQVGCSFISPFLNNGKYLPLSLMPITIEIELDAADAAFSGSPDWEITRPRLLGDVCQLDQSLSNSYAQHLLQGKSLPFQCEGLYSIRTTVTSGSRFSYPIARGFTNLTAIYISLWDGNGSWITNFYHPSAGGPNATVIDDFNWNITIGADKFPIFDCESTQESYYRLRLCEQTHGGRDSFGITPWEYYTNSFIIGQSLEKAPGSAWTGYNSRSGSQLTINCKELHNASTMHIVLRYAQIVNLSAAGTQVLD